MLMIKVSVVIPVYGVEKFIARSARSLFEQTLDNLEYIFVNDCTKDYSMEILKDILEEYPYRKSQVRIIEMPTNSGLPTVRRHGTQLATGEYLIHCDSDDWIDADMYRLMYEKAITDDLDIVWCDYYKSDGSNHYYISQRYQPELMQGPLWNKLVRRSIYESNDIIYPTANKAEDGVLMTQISFFAKSRGYIDRPLYFYFINPDSICGQINEFACVRKLEQEVENTNLRINFLEREGALNKYESVVLEWKYTARTNLLPLMNIRKYRKLWRNTFAELNRLYLQSNAISIRQKVKFILIYIGLYRKL